MNSQTSIQNRTGMMPRTSAKAQLLSQMQDLWLANSISTVLFDETDFALWQQILNPQQGWNAKSNADDGLEPNGRGVVGDLLWLMRDFGCQTMGGSSDVGIGLVGAEDGLEEEIVEAIEVLLLGIQGTRYLSPREPIPRSEYLLNYHVCKKERKIRKNKK